MVTRKKREQIKEAAGKFLLLADIEKPPVSVNHIARLQGVQVRYVPCEEEMAGLLYREGEQVIIGVNALNTKTRQRFTIAHELGYLQINGPEKLHVDVKFNAFIGNPGASKAIDTAEIEANIFAFELLMPEAFLKRDIIEKDYDIEDEEWVRTLADKYKVSMSIMAFRLSDLDLTLSLPSVATRPLQRTQSQICG
ncbi:MAG TPA: ImmA/IrrE family metallo-endopeptidase [Blastocatellia bacterium]|nr:ImmA/IrrE family metallo-endopeptidase [Blastocatellia bacterium]